MRGRPVHIAELAQRILDQLSGGRSLRAVCAKEIGQAKTGRPTLHTPELAQLILDELASGRTLAEVCRDPDMPVEGTVRLWVIENREGFAADYTIARQFGDDAMADQMLDIVDNRRHDWMPRRKPNGETEYILDPERVRRAELRVKTRWWLLSKGLRRKYGAPKD
jgi:hypothetical protein